MEVKFNFVRYNLVGLGRDLFQVGLISGWVGLGLVGVGYGLGFAAGLVVSRSWFCVGLGWHKGV